MSFVGIPLAVWLFVPAAVLLYLYFDLYPLVPKSTFVMVTTGSFWIFFLAECILTVIAYVVLRTSYGAYFDALVGRDFSPVAMVFLAVVANLFFVQSLSFKLAGKKWRETSVRLGSSEAFHTGWQEAHLPAWRRHRQESERRPGPTALLHGDVLSTPPTATQTPQE
jgi:hypothetical protein